MSYGGWSTSPGRWCLRRGAVRPSSTWA
jgi:hypothetical protein